MKKILALPVILLLLLTACGDRIIEPPPIPQSFRATLAVTGADCALQCQWEQLRPNHAVFRITEPEALAGLSLIFDGRDCRAEFKGLETDANLPAKALFRELLEAIDTREHLSVSERNGVLEISGNISTGTFTIRQGAAEWDYRSFALPHGTVEVLSVNDISS